jgi:hypothetical protein
MDLTAAKVIGFALAGKEKTGNPDFRRRALPQRRELPFVARSEFNFPAGVRLAPADLFETPIFDSSYSNLDLIAA